MTPRVMSRFWGYPVFTYILLLSAGFAAGALNAVAGGGTFLSFPALVWAGVPPIAANATATLAALPGYAGSAWGYRRDLRAEGSLSVAAIIALSAVGGLLGAVLLLVTSAETFSAIVPWLLLLATVVFATGPLILRWVTRKGGAGPGKLPAGAAMLAVAVYGGYFNGGLGIMVLAIFGLIGFTNLNAMNGLKNVVSTILSVVAVATYVAAGLIDWTYALPLAIACAAGGYIGATLARKLTNPFILRIFITVIGALMTIAFFAAR